MVSQLMGLLGQVGALLAAGPLAAALNAFGWTPSYAGSASIGVLTGVLLVLIVRDSPYDDQARDALRLRALARSLRLAWNVPGTRLGLWSHFVSQFSANVFTLLWGFPFLVSGEGVSPAAASTLLMVMVGSAMVLSILFGSLTARFPFSRSTLVLWIVAIMIAVWTVVLLWPGRAPMWLLFLLVVVVAAGGPGSMIGFDLARTFNPPTRLGSANGIVNTGGFIATLTAVALIGIVLDRIAPGGPSTWTMDAFRPAMAVQYLIWALGIIQVLRYRGRARRAALAIDPEGYDAMRGGSNTVTFLE
jgi:sugar phosphate permease